MLDRILQRVKCPARYVGGEWNIVRKNPGDVKVKFAMCFPDTYEVGMSHLGSKILYHEVNKREDALCERVFCPWTDMEAELRANAIPLFSLENKLPLSDFDVVGFTLQYELTYTNILNMLDLGGIPLLSRDRQAGDAIVFAGGPCAFNPEPLAAFIDAFALGEGEDVIHDIIEVVKREGGKHAARDSLLRALAGIDGVYVPSLYDVLYGEDGKVLEVRPNRPGVPPKVKKRIVRDLDLCDYPTSPVVPYIDVVHDRAVVEVFRGCTRGCRFCQAGAIYRPVRERSPEIVRSHARDILEHTGYDEVSLTSLSSSDYSKIDEVIEQLLAAHGQDRVGVSLPSLRVDAFSVGLAEKVQRVRRTGLTFAPEAGTQRLRDVINKNVSGDDITEAARAAFSGGFGSLKLYFMIGLPTETEEDVQGIASMAKDLLALSRQVRGQPAKLTVSVASFVPKAHTPFQWEPQDTLEVLEAKQSLLRSLLKPGKIQFDWHDTRTSFVEAVMARGDRRLARVIELAYLNGARFDGWTDQFKFDVWANAFLEAGIDPAFYANRRRSHDEVLPWDHISAGVSKKWLVREHQRALSGQTTQDCRWSACRACGVCTELSAERILRGARS